MHSPLYPGQDLDSTEERFPDKRVEAQMKKAIARGGDVFENPLIRGSCARSIHRNIEVTQQGPTIESHEKPAQTLGGGNLGPFRDDFRKVEV
jgi:hypothetical protein